MFNVVPEGIDLLCFEQFTGTAHQHSYQQPGMSKL